MSPRVDLRVWRLSGGDDAILSVDERARAARFVAQRDRDRFVAGRARLRVVLGRYLGVAPERVRLHYGPRGRPMVDGLFFNLSHTGDLAVLAVSREVELGVDVEAIRPIEDGVAESHFAPGEIAALRACHAEERAVAFYRLWTRKEAYVKGRGDGLWRDLASFEVSAGERPSLLHCDSGEAGRWTLRDLALMPGVAGALAARTDGVEPALRVLRDR